MKAKKEPVYILRFRAVNRDTFEAILNGTKKIETRAATDKYMKVKRGDVLMLQCGKAEGSVVVKEISYFKTVGALAKVYRVSDVNPACTNEKELRAMYKSFPGYTEKIKKHGIVAWEVKVR